MMKLNESNDTLMSQPVRSLTLTCSVPEFAYPRLSYVCHVCPAEDIPANILERKVRGGLSKLEGL